MQTAYNTSPAPGVPGMLYDNGPADDISKLAQGLVPIGILVGWGTDGQAPATVNSGQVALLSDGLTGPLADSAWAGVSLADPSLAPMTVQAGQATASYADKDSVPLAKKSTRVWVLTETATTEGHDVYVRVATGTGAQVKGAFADGAAAGFVLFPRGRWASTSPAGCAVLQLY